MKRFKRDAEFVKKVFTPEKAKIKAEAYCAYQERSQQEVRDKIYTWGLHKNDVENLITNLIENGFLKEERFAIAYAGGKFRIKKWGRNKIRQALIEKKVSEPLINKALKEIDDKDYHRVLTSLINERIKVVNEKNVLKRNHKVATYAISRGFESELVWEMLNSI